jgi:hypothetical protein
VEATWQEVYSDKEQMSVLVNGWEKWEPTDDLKKGKDLLLTNWTIIEINKKRRGGGEMTTMNDKMDFELDNANLKRVTGLTKLAGEEESMLEESDDDGVPTNVEAIAAGDKGGIW